jgi:hypothetical protein
MSGLQAEEEHAVREGGWGLTRWLLVTCCALTIALPSAARADDRDKDGLPDAVEEQLGTDPKVAHRLAMLADFPAKSLKQPELNIVKVEFAKVGKDRWLWAIHFAKPYTFDNSSLIIYLDSDNDSKTGRHGVGCEMMLAQNCGRPSVTAFESDGTKRAMAAPRIAIVDGVLYLCHDGTVKQENDKPVFRFTIASESREPHTRIDATGWVRVTQQPISETQ